MRAPSRESSLAAAALLCGVMAAREPRLVPLLTLGGWTGGKDATDAAPWAADAPPPPDATGVVRAENEAASWRDAVADKFTRPSIPAAARLRSRVPGGDVFSSSSVMGARPASRESALAPRGPAGRRAPRDLKAHTVSTGARAVDRSENAPSGAGASGEPSPSSVPSAATASATRRAARSQFLGPAPNDDSEPTSAARHAFRRGSRGAHAWAFHPDARARRAARRAAHPGRLRPLTLSKLLGKGALKPPNPALAPADLAELRGRGTADALRLEGVDPAARLPACRLRTKHWDGEVRHEGANRGLRLGDAWLWMRRDSGRWWAGIGDAPDAYLRHGAGWWLKQKGLWYLSHLGMPWYPRTPEEWGESVLLHPPSGTKMVYSADLTLVALIVPGDGAALYDARTGSMLARWSEEEMPRRRHRAPPSLTLP